MTRLTKEWLNLAADSVYAVDRLVARKPPLYDVAYGHCKGAVEAYFKALLQHWGLFVPPIDDLRSLLARLLPRDGSLDKLRRGLDKLTEHADEVGYPGAKATPQEFNSARRLMECVKREVRTRLGLDKPRRQKSA